MIQCDWFSYPNIRHCLHHGPSGYQNHRYYKPWLRDEFTFRCIYCLRREQWLGGDSHFSVEHAIPQSVAPHLALEYDNLRYACSRCNSIRQDRPVIDSCVEPPGAHLNIREDGVIEGLTPLGVSHIKVLRLDDPALTQYRAWLTRVIRQLETIGDRDTIAGCLGFPEDLPDLASLRPPSGNTRAQAVKDCWYEFRKRNVLPQRY